MAIDRRRANATWKVLDEAGLFYRGSYEGAQLAVLLDLRDELQKLNALLHCHNFTGIPVTLRSIRRAVAVKRKAKK